MFFNPSLEQKQRGNQYQQQSHGGFDEVVDAGAIDLPQVHQKRYAEVRAWNAADGHRQYDLLSHCALPQMHDAGGNLREKVEQRIATDGNDSGNVQAKDEHGQQQYAATQSRQPDQRSNREADQYFQQQEFHAVSWLALSSQFSVNQIQVKELRTENRELFFYPLPLAPTKPSRSRCRIMVCAASSGLSLAVSITTSALIGASYGSEMPVNSFTMPARALAYRPLRSRCSHTSIEVAACTRINPPNGSIICRTALRVAS